MAARAPLGQHTPAGFLQHYWQQKPLLIRQALANDALPTLSPDELAGLACETDVESRLILEKDGPHPWYLENGPFDAERFANLSDSHWTLLVQDVDKYIPQIAELLQQFRFIPDWRIDDVMISYAVDQGSVGPHVDNYDVFLLQLRGQRRWQISTQPGADDNFIPDIPLNILQHFTAEQEWLLEPGDMLYLPPSIAHHGIAVGDCMTCSVGFRAPSYADLIGSFSDDYLAGQTVTRFYQDPGRPLPEHPAHLDSQSLAELRAILRLQQLPDSELDNWLGCFLTEAKQHDAVLPLDTPMSPETIGQLFDTSAILVRNPWARMIYTREQGQLTLYAAGRRVPVETDLLEALRWLCDHDIYDLQTVPQWHHNPAFLTLLTTLINFGVVLIDEAD